MKTKIGIFGHGRIGSSLAKKIQEDELLELGFVYDVNQEKTKSVDAALLLQEPKDFDKFNVDLVVEAADARAVRALAPDVLKKVDMLILSVTALADKTMEDELRKVCEENQTKLYIPHGAIVGIDGIQDAREVLEEVSITTTKHPRNLDFSYTDEFDRESITKETVVYEGPTREVCKFFPRNVNVHAVLALAGLGFDRTSSKLIANPNLEEAVHHIVAKSSNMTLDLKISSKIKGVTGAFTLVSVYGTIKRIATKKYGIHIF